ncbi:feruloyl esterase [Parastagonospora nodorum]|uniref:feruloyl esterase n=1 Tax=Phaeosphaeria nodorum (strain SN15 / ATCC MYA-4574 / FGSC 10173) TaxID=321614 RepID=A0A7U2IC90_PHANO|nr:feruloyl esterase [Parastagonospora nodorum]QRD07146.1 feruloyl esterase [Parastagonospora nodorum SN15]KAH3930144.1 feruloyl esterase [Parastagonospora nodorum]KAH3945175.1 feruloyl esterase [Parastagonospora nodorum]KAH3967035.1 feruloyl esterase [Parastagonospora nodorum]
MTNLFVALLFFRAFFSSVHALPRDHVAQRSSSGCGKKPFLPGVTQYRFLKSSNKDRSYSFHLPSSYDARKPYAVVLGFHGSSSIGAFFELDTKLSQERYSSNKIMIYPNGVGGSWAGPTYHDGSTIAEDVQFVQDVIDDAKEQFCVDENHFFGVGMSNGGGFISTLACDPVGSKLFKAVAAHSGAFYTDINGPSNGCSPAKKIPILEIHGATDKTVKYEGGQGDGGPQPAISNWLDWWAQRNSCTGKTEEVIEDGNVQHYSWSCDGIEGLLQHYKVEGLGHCWADTEPNLSQISVPQLPTVIRASVIAMKFFDDMS